MGGGILYHVIIVLYKPKIYLLATMLKGPWIDWSWLVPTWMACDWTGTSWKGPFNGAPKWTVGRRVRLATLKRYLKQNNVSKVITKQLGTWHPFLEMFGTQDAMLCYEEYHIFVDLFLFGDPCREPSPVGIPRKTQECACLDEMP